jgi:two-component system, cell cycle response regulator
MLSEERRLSNHDILMLFNYATRLVALESNGDRIFEQSLEALSVLAQDRKVALYTVTPQKGVLQLEGVFAAKKYHSVKAIIPCANTPFEKVIAEKSHGVYATSPREVFGAPFPTYRGDPAGVTCLCLPVGGTGNSIVGVAVIENQPEEQWSIFDTQMFITFTTIIALSVENSKLYKLATVDGLTGLFLRAFFEIRLEEEIARTGRNGGVLSVLLADIDDFKEINDVHGHQYGDLVLKDFASILEAGLRKGVDIPCRYGGDEFAVLILDAGREDCLAVAERIRAQCEAHAFDLGGGTRKVTISAGLVVMDSGRVEPSEEIMDRVDSMLYRAKGFGKNRVCLWGEGSDA